LKWAKTLLGNLKMAIPDTRMAIRQPYVRRYFAEFNFRSNGRHNLPRLFTKFLAAAAGEQRRSNAAIRLA